MKKKTVRRPYYSRPIRRYAYPNAAEPGYFLNKALDYITVAVSGFGLATTLFFLATIYVAIGLFTSSLTDNQIVAFICAALLSFAFFYGFDLISSLLISGEEQTFVSSLGISSHYDGMSRGVIDSRDLLYFILVDAAFVYLTKLILSKKK